MALLDSLPLTTTSPTTPADYQTSRQVFSIGNVFLNGFEAPSLLHLIREHRFACHEFIGGGRSVQSLGPQWGPVRWNGKMVPQHPYVNYYSGEYQFTQSDQLQDPVARALQLDTMCSIGDAVELVYGGLSWQVVIEAFDYDIIHANEVEYSINLIVVASKDITSLKATKDLSEFDVLLELQKLTVSALDLINLVKNSEIYLILASDQIAAIESGESSLISLAALINAEALGNLFSSTLGTPGLGLIDKANQLTSSAVLMKSVFRL